MGFRIESSKKKLQVNMSWKIFAALLVCLVVASHHQVAAEDDELSELLDLFESLTDGESLDFLDDMNMDDRIEQETPLKTNRNRIGRRRRRMRPSVSRFLPSDFWQISPFRWSRFFDDFGLEDDVILGSPWRQWRSSRRCFRCRRCRQTRRGRRCFMGRCCMPSRRFVMW